MKATEITGEKTRRAAGCLIMAKNSEEFLFIQRSDKVESPLLWSIPGGHVDEGENPLEAAVREVEEEAGHKIDPSTCKLLYVNDMLPNDLTYYTYICVSDKFKPELNWESNDYTWCTLDNAPEPEHIGIKLMFNNQKVRERVKQFMKDQGVV